MKQPVFILILSISPVLLFSSCNKKIEINDTEIKNELYYEIGKSEPYTGLLVAYYENGQQGEEAEIVDGKYHGETTSWQMDGQKTREGYFKANLREGNAKVWDENGDLIYDENYLNDKMHGRQRIYKKGVLIEESHYESGVPHGLVTHFNEKGGQLRTANYKHGIMDGEAKKFHDNGAVSEVSHLKDGKPSGLFQRFTKDGVLLEEGNP